MKKTLFICMLLATALLYAQPSAAKSKKKKTAKTEQSQADTYNPQNEMLSRL